MWDSSGNVVNVQNFPPSPVILQKKGVVDTSTSRRVETTTSRYTHPLKVTPDLIEEAETRASDRDRVRQVRNFVSPCFTKSAVSLRSDKRVTGHSASIEGACCCNDGELFCCKLVLCSLALHDPCLAWLLFMKCQARRLPEDVAQLTIHAQHSLTELFEESRSSSA